MKKYLPAAAASLLALVITLGYGWFIIAWAGRGDIPPWFRFAAGFLFVSFGGGMAGMAYGGWRKLGQEKKRAEKEGGGSKKEK